MSSLLVSCWKWMFTLTSFCFPERVLSAWSCWSPPTSRSRGWLWTGARSPALSSSTHPCLRSTRRGRRWEGSRNCLPPRRRLPAVTPGQSLPPPSPSPAPASGTWWMSSPFAATSSRCGSSGQGTQQVVASGSTLLLIRTCNRKFAPLSSLRGSSLQNGRWGSCQSVLEVCRWITILIWWECLELQLNPSW